MTTQADIERDMRIPADNARKPAGAPAATRYVVLALTPANTWQALATVPAHNSDAAIRETVAQQDPATTAATFVAVPERSWKPVTVRTETRTVLKFEDA